MEPVSPVIELLKLPTPLPSVVFVLNVMVAPGTVLQQTPREVTVDPPSDVILPPDVAVVSAIDVIAVVLRAGSDVFNVVNVSFLPYDVPAKLVAKALTLYVLFGFNPEIVSE